jgi:hypothetical protein
MNRSVVALVAASVVVAGCGQQLSPAQPVAIVPGPAQMHYTAHPDRGPSWMRPGAAAKKALIYASDADTNDVDVYDYTKGTQVGTLTGFDAVRRPQGRRLSSMSATIRPSSTNTFVVCAYAAAS